jgi:hypothetical protein
MRTFNLPILLLFVVLFSQKINAGNITETEKKGLQLMREEEKLAHDVYQFLYEKWHIPIFSNIAKNEMRHFEAVGFLLNNYNVKDPAVFEKGMFANLEIEHLYGSLTQAGSKSLLTALEVGAFIEEVDIEDLQILLQEGKNEQINVVYENFLRGSRNHLRAFTGQIENRGINYQPKILQAENYKAIVNAVHERGNGNGPCFNTENSSGNGRGAGNRFRNRGIRRGINN